VGNQEKQNHCIKVQGQIVRNIDLMGSLPVVM